MHKKLTPANYVAMALAMQARFLPLSEQWRRLGHDLKLGIGIARGYATLGALGYEGRFDYTAIGGVVNIITHQPFGRLLKKRFFCRVTDQSPHFMRLLHCCNKTKRMGTQRIAGWCRISNLNVPFF